MDKPNSTVMSLMTASTETTITAPPEGQVVTQLESSDTESLSKPPPGKGGDDTVKKPA